MKIVSEVGPKKEALSRFTEREKSTRAYVSARTAMKKLEAELKRSQTNLEVANIRARNLESQLLNDHKVSLVRGVSSVLNGFGVVGVISLALLLLLGPAALEIITQLLKETPILYWALLLIVVFKLARR